MKWLIYDCTSRRIFGDSSTSLGVKALVVTLNLYDVSSLDADTLLQCKLNLDRNKNI